MAASRCVPRPRTPRIRGDFTCPAAAAAAGDDPIANPYGCDEPSHDEQRFDTVGLTAAFGWRLGTRSTSPELTLAAGSHRFDGAFHVDATYVGFQDTTHLTNKSWITTAAVGLAVPVGERSASTSPRNTRRSRSSDTSAPVRSNGASATTCSSSERGSPCACPEAAGTE